MNFVHLCTRVIDRSFDWLAVLGIANGVLMVVVTAVQWSIQP